MLSKINIKNSLLIIILFYFVFNYNFHKLEFYYDDYWFISIFKNNNNFFANFNILKEYYIVRPIGLIYLSLLSVITVEKLSVYYLINITIWLASSLLLYLSFSKIFNKKFALIFLFFYLFPSISSAFIFSPIIQGLSTISIFFWSLSVYFLSIEDNPKGKIMSIFFIVLSFLSYEISFSLIPINIFIYCYLKNIFLNDFKHILTKIFKILVFSLIIVIIFYIFQKFVSGFSKANIIKYGFKEEDFFINLKKYFFSPLKVLYLDIPKLWFLGAIKSLKKIDLFLFILVIFFNSILYFLFTNKEINFYKISLKNSVYFNISLTLVFIGIFLIYLVATSVPDITGYYSRGLLCLHILFSIYLSQVIYTKNKILIFLTFIIFNLNFISMYQKFIIHLENGYERKKIVNSTKLISEKNHLIFTNFKTFKSNNYNSIPVFSDEVFDYQNAVNFYSNQKIIANRIYKNKNCHDILSFNNNILSGKVPSRNRKIKEKQNLQFMKVENSKINNTFIIIFDYNKNKFVKGNIDNLDILLRKVFNCS